MFIYSCICTRPIVKARFFLFFFVGGDFLHGIGTLGSRFLGQGGFREVEDLYIKQNSCIYDLAALIDLESLSQGIFGGVFKPTFANVRVCTYSTEF